MPPVGWRSPVNAETARPVQGVGGTHGSYCYPNTGADTCRQCRRRMATIIESIEAVGPSHCGHYHVCNQTMPRVAMRLLIAL